MSRWACAALALLVVVTGCDSPEGPPPVGNAPSLQLKAYQVPEKSHPHDVAPAADGGVWFTAQRAGYLGHLNPSSGDVTRVPLGQGSAPHGVIVGADGAAWVTDSGLNAIVRVDAATREVRRFPLPSNRSGANLNTAAFDKAGVLWFTGQSGIYGKLDPRTGDLQVFAAPKGRGPYGIAATPSGQIYYASLAGSHIARVDTATGQASVLEPPTRGQGARRVWADSKGRLWVSEWNAGKLGMHDPASGAWKEWPLPGKGPKAYAVYVDDKDNVWVSDFGANTLVRFDPETEKFESVRLPGDAAEVRQILGRPGEVWGAASALDQLVVVRAAG